MAVKLTLTNMTQHQWSVMWHMLAEKGLKTVKQSPPKLLGPLQQGMLWIDQESLGWWTHGNFSCSILLSSFDNPVIHFGVCAHAPLHFLFFGAHPKWGIGTNNSAGDFIWTNEVADQSSQQTVRLSDDLSVLLTPVISHNDLELSATFIKSMKTKNGN